MPGKLTAIVCVVALCLNAAVASDLWRMGEPALIYPGGTSPDVWDGGVAFLNGAGGPVMFYDGVETTQIHEPLTSDWEVQNTNGSLAWRYTESGVSSNEIYRWDGQSIINVSNSPGVVDCDLTGGGNGDLLWCREHEDLMYYDLSENVVTDLGVSGVHPSMYVTEEGVATYVYQDPDTDEVFYFDGETTHLLGAGNSNGASPSVWDGAVTWVGQGDVGSYFTKGEIFYWKDGVTTRITNDDEAGSGIADEYPVIWYDTVVWCRGINGIFSPKLFIWDRYGISQLTFANSKFPSLHNGKLAWAGDEGLYTADLYRSGDLDYDHDVDLSDLAVLLANFGNSGATYEQGDINEDGEIGHSDLAILLALYGYHL